MTFVGAMDPIEVARKLEKHWYTEILTIGAKEEPKKIQPNRLRAREAL